MPNLMHNVYKTQKHKFIVIHHSI